MTAPGEFVLAAGSRFHVRRFDGSAERTILLEAGLTMMSSCWGWLAPELAKVGTVLAYDRAGLGWSDEREGLRDAKQIAEELTALVELMPQNGELILVGHSMGAMFNRAFLKQHPDRAARVIWLDPTHPEQLARSRRMQAFFFFLEVAHLLAARNLPSITLRIVPHLSGLPKVDFQALSLFLKSARHLKTTAWEARAAKQSGEYLRGNTLGKTPLLVISAQKNALRNSVRYQQELAALSSNSRHITFTDMSHLSMLAQQEHCGRVTKEIISFLAEAR
ncbi:MAG: alpha/beta fold hydrolase [Limisphaerales bacterium]